MMMGYICEVLQNCCEDPRENFDLGQIVIFKNITNHLKTLYFLSYAM